MELETTQHITTVSDVERTFKVLIFEGASIYAFPTGTLQM